MRRRSKHTRTHVYIYVLDTMIRNERGKAVYKEIEYLLIILIIYLMSIKKENLFFFYVYQYFFSIFLVCYIYTKQEQQTKNN